MVRSAPRERRHMAYSAISSGASPVMSGPFARRTTALAMPNMPVVIAMSPAVSPNALRYTMGSSVRISKSPTPMLTAPTGP